jgi:hypothetical protein
MVFVFRAKKRIADGLSGRQEKFSPLAPGKRRKKAGSFNA